MVTLILGRCGIASHSSRSYHQEWYDRHKDQHREKYQADRDRRLARRRELNASRKHDDLTYLRYSPGLGIYKIGHTTNLFLNHRDLRRGCPDIELVTTFPHGRDLERWLHRRFDDVRVRGTEWFNDITEIDVRNAVAEFEKLESER